MRSLLTNETLFLNIYNETNFVEYINKSSRSKTLPCFEFKSSAKGTSISKLQNIKIKRDNYNAYIHSNKANIIIFCSLAPNQIRKCGNFKLWFCRGRRGIVVKHMPHVCSTLIFPCSTKKILNS